MTRPTFCQSGSGGGGGRVEIGWWGEKGEGERRFDLPLGGGVMEGGWGGRKYVIRTDSKITLHRQYLNFVLYQ